VIDRLIPYAKNARTHTDAQVAAIAASIKEWGCGGSSEAAELRREGTNLTWPIGGGVSDFGSSK
jgi:hypothetical protein